MYLCLSTAEGLKKYVWTKMVVESRPSFWKGLIFLKLSLLHLSKRMYIYIYIYIYMPKYTSFNT
jgi:hypothetical protein